MRGVLGFVLNLEQVAAGELKVLSVSTTPNGQFMKLQLVSELILSSAAFEIVPMQQELGASYTTSNPPNYTLVP